MSININYGMTIMQSIKQLKATKLLSKRYVLKHKVCIKAYRMGVGIHMLSHVYSNPTY